MHENPPEINKISFVESFSPTQSHAIIEVTKVVVIMMETAIVTGIKSSILP